MRFWVRFAGRYRPLAQVLSAQAIGAEGLGFDSRDGQIGTVSPTARHLCDVSVFPRRYVPEIGSQPLPLLTIAEKMKPFFFETNQLFFVRSCPKLLSCFFCSVQLFNLILRNFHYDAMQQYRYSNFSDVFCLNCIFVIDAALKQLMSRSFFKCGVFAVTKTAHKILLKNQIFIILVSLNLLWYRSMVASGGTLPRGLVSGQRSSEESLQPWRTVGYTTSNLTGLGIEPQNFRIDGDICNTAL